jgi:hypothetical protein
MPLVIEPISDIVIDKRERRVYFDGTTKSQSPKGWRTFPPFPEHLQRLEHERKKRVFKKENDELFEEEARLNN